VIRAAAETAGQRRERRVTFDVGEIHARAPDLVHPGIGDGGLVGTAAAARSESGCACVGGRVEKRHAIAVRAAARTRRAAIHARGMDGVDERAVSAPVARHHGRPQRLFVVSGFSQTCVSRT
jgi:hypothetical protein